MSAMIPSFPHTLHILPLPWLPQLVLLLDIVIIDFTFWSKPTTSVVFVEGSLRARAFSLDPNISSFSTETSSTSDFCFETALDLANFDWKFSAEGPAP